MFHTCIAFCSHAFCMRDSHSELANISNFSPVFMFFQVCHLFLVSAQPCAPCSPSSDAGRIPDCAVLILTQPYKPHLPDPLALRNPQSVCCTLPSPCAVSPPGPACTPHSALWIRIPHLAIQATPPGPARTPQSAICTLHPAIPTCSLPARSRLHSAFCTPDPHSTLAVHILPLHPRIPHLHSAFHACIPHSAARIRPPAFRIPLLHSAFHSHIPHSAVAFRIPLTHSAFRCCIPHSAPAFRARLR